jgi:hypothetical protein
LQQESGKQPDNSSGPSSKIHSQEKFSFSVLPLASKSMAFIWDMVSPR